MQVTHSQLPGQPALCMVTITNMGASRRWVFTRQLDLILHGSEGDSSNLLHLSKRLGVDGSITHYVKAGDLEPIGLDQADVGGLMKSFNAMRRQYDPMTGTARRFSLMPANTACFLALSARHRPLLEALGGERMVPDDWVEQDLREEEDRTGEIEGNRLPVRASDSSSESDDELAPTEELLHNALMGFELAARDPHVVADADNSVGTYTLQQPSATLLQQLEDYKKHRTSILVATRSSVRVAGITVDGDCSTMLRFLGWLKSEPSVDSGRLDFSVFNRPDSAIVVEQFAVWLKEKRDVEYSTVAGYLNSLLCCCVYAHSALPQPEGADQQDTVVDALFNLRRQCEAQSKEDSLYKALHAEWLTWQECQLTRLASVLAADGALAPGSHASQADRLKLCEDACIIAFYTAAPPDRVGIIRTLSINCTGATLRKMDGGNGPWVIDLTAPRLHKTAKWYGATITKLSETLLVPNLERFLAVTNGPFEFTDGEMTVENRTDKKYLFSTSHSSRCYSSSAWTSRVKSAFGRHSPGGKCPPPKLLRKAFVTALRSSPDCPKSLLDSAAKRMKHSVSTQSSTYDVERHSRETLESRVWCEKFAAHRASSTGSTSWSRGTTCCCRGAVSGNDC